MSTLWTNSAGGLWTVGGNWSGGVVPTVSDDVALGVLSGSYTVTLTANGTAKSLTLANYTVTLDLSTTSGSAASLAIQGDVSNAGYLSIDTGSTQGGSSLTIGGTLTNTYYLQIGNSNLSAATTVTAAALVNTGNIYLYGGTGTDTNRATLDITAGATPAINAGTLQLASGATVRGQGDFNNSGALYVDYNYYAGSDLAITGTLRNTGNLYIGGYSPAASGSSTVSAADLVNTNGIYLTGGTGTSTYKAILDITAAAAPSVLTGTLSLTGNALVEFAGGSIAGIASGASLTLNGANAFVADAGSITSNSALTGLASNAGTLDLESGAAVSVLGDFANNGTLRVDYSYYTAGSDLAIAGTLTNTGTLYIGANYQAGSGSTTVSAADLVNTNGIYLAGGTGTSTYQAILDITTAAAPSVLTGTLSLIGNALVEFAGGSIGNIAYRASLTLNGANSFIADAGNTTSNSALTALANNAGTLDLESGAAVSVLGDFANNGTLSVDYSYYTAGSDLAIVGTLTNTSTLYIGANYQVGSGSTTVSAAALANTGYITLAGGTGTSTYQTTLDITTAAAPPVLTGIISLTGNALVEFAGGSIAGIASAASLTLNGANAFVADAGSLTSNSALTGLANNAGTLDLEGGAAVSMLGDFANNGTLKVDYSYYTAGSDLAITGTLTNTGNLYIGANYQAGSGSTTVSAADLVNTGGMYLAGGTGTSTYQATLDITAATAPSVLTGTLSLSGQALVEFAGGSITSIAGGANLTLNGANAFVADAGSITSNSALTGLSNNAGTLDLESGAAVSVLGDFANNGTLRIDYSYYTAGSDLAITGTLTNTGTLYIGANYQAGTGNSAVSTAALANTGYITLAGGTGTSTYQAILDITAATAPSVLTGTLSLTGNALVEFAGGSITSIAGGANLTLNGANAFVADAGSITSNSALTGLASNAGTLDLESGAAVSALGDFANNGTLRIDYSYYTAGSDLAIGGTLTNTGNLYIGANYQAGSGGTTVSAADLVNTGGIYLAGGTGTSTYQTTLDITSSATDNGAISLYGDAILSAGSLTVANGGTVTLTSGGTATGITIGSGGREIVSSGGTSVAPTIAGGILELAGGQVSGGGIVFAGGGTLQIDGTTMPTNPISGFTAGDTIDLRALTFDSTTTASYDSATRTLTVSGGGVTDALTLSGIPAGTGFAVASDGNGGTKVTAATAAGPGTRWINSAGGDWTVASNWSAGVPTSATDALIGAPGGYTVTLAAGAAANSLIIDHAGANLSMVTSSRVGARLAIQGDLTNSGGLAIDTGSGLAGSTLSVGGTLTTVYSVQIGNGAASAATIVSATSLTNAGSLYLHGGSSAGPMLATTGDFTNTAYVYVDLYSGEGNSQLSIGGTLTNAYYMYIGNGNLAAATTVSAASLVNTNTIYLTGGTGTNTNQATLDIAGAAPPVLTGTFNLSGHALLDFAGGITGIANNGSLTLSGADAFVADTSINTTSNSGLKGLASNAGRLEFDNGAVVQTTSGLINNGSLYVDGYYSNTGGSALAIIGTLTNAYYMYIGNGNLAAATTVSAASLVNTGTGTITLAGGTGTNTNQATLDIAGAPAPVLTGTFNLSGHALLDFAGGITGLANNANLMLNGTSAFIADTSINTTSNSALNSLASNAGRLELDNGAAVQTTGDFINNGTLYVDGYYSNTGGSALAIIGTLTNAYYMYIGNGNLAAATTVSAASLVNTGTGTITLAGGTGTNTNQATLDIAGAAAPVLTGTFTLSGHALLDFAGGITGLANNANLTLNGTSAFIADTSINTTSNSALNSLASNAGRLELDNGAVVQTTGNFINNGTLYVDGYYSNTGGSALAIGGTLTNAYYMYIGNGNLAAATTVSAASLVNTGTGTITLTGGTGTNTNQATLDIAGAAPPVLTGTFTLSGHALLDFAGGITGIANNGSLTLSGADAFVADTSINTTSNSGLKGLASNAGRLEFDNGAAVQTTGNFINNGSLYVDGYYSNTGGSALAILGTLTNAYYMYIGNGNLAAATTVNAASLVNTGTGTITLAGGTGTNTNQATLDIAGAAPPVLTGTFNLSGHALLEFAGGITGIANNGSLTLSGADAFVADTSINTTSNSALRVLASNAGRLELDTGAQINIQGDFSNSGSLEVDYYYYNVAGSNLTIGGTLTNTGSLYFGYTYQTTSATTVSVASLANSGSITLYGGSGTAGHQTTLDIAGAATDSGAITLYGDATLSAGSLTVANGGTLDLSSGGTATGVIVGSGGHEYVYSGGVATNATIAGGILELGGGTVAAATIDFTLKGGVLQIDTAAMPSNTITGFRQGDIIDLRAVAFDGSGTASIDSATNLLTVSGGGSTYALQLDPLHNYTSAAVILTSDGSSSGTDVAIISPPIFVSSGQTLTIPTSATYDNINVLSGGTLTVLTGGTATDTIDSGTELLRGTDLSGIVGAGGTLVVAAGGMAFDTAVSTQGQMTVASGGIAIDPTIAGGTLDLAAGAVARGTIAFFGSGGTLEIDDATMPTNAITGFAPGDIIDLRALVWSPTNSASFDSATNTLTVSGSGTTDTLTLIGVPAGMQFAVTSDGHGGTTIGTLQSNGILTGSYFSGVVLTHNPTTLTATAYVTNQTTAYNGDAVYGPNTAAWTFNNQGTINAVGTAGAGVELTAGGSVSNTASSALIAGYVNGVVIGGSAGTVSNLGTVAGTGTSGLGVYLAVGGSVSNGAGGAGGALIGGGFAGVKLQNGGTVANGATSGSTATITGGKYGIWAETAPASVTNHGTVAATGASGDALFLYKGGTVINAAGALISGVDDGICLAANTGTVINSGTITGAVGVELQLGGSVTNYGTIGGAGAGGTATNLTQGGVVVNAAGAVLAAGGDAVVICGTSGGNVVNYGTIGGGNDGIVLKAAGSAVVNDGTITGTASYGVYLYSGNTATNASTGLIAGRYAGVLATHSAGTVTNFGTIAGTGSNGIGVNLMVAGSTLTNAGTIDGGGAIAVYFTGANNRLIIAPGAVFVGSVYGGSGSNNVLELAAGTLAATGTLAGGAGRYPGFDHFQVDASARWQLTGLPILAPGATLSNAGTIDIVTGLTVGGSLSNTGVIDIDSGATLALANGASGTGSIDFVGSGGTLAIGGTTMPAATITISGFAPGDTIDLRGVSGGAAGSATLGANHLLTVFEGGTPFALQLDPAQSFGGFGLVDDGSGGTDLLALAPVIVSAGVSFVVSAGQTLIGVSVQSGGTLEVGPGASVFGTQIASGGSEIVDSGGFDSGALVFNGGSQTVLFGGTALGTVLDGVAVQDVFGSAGGTTVSSGDSQIVESGGVASGTTISLGGIEIVSAGGLTIDTVIAGGVLELSGGAVASGGIDFVGIGGVLQIDSNTMPTATISGFTLGDAIDLRGLPFNAGNALTFSAGVLTVSGSTVDTLTLSGVPSGTVFGLADDGSGNTLVQEIVPVTTLFDFVFTYNDGRDYYYGTVADDGTLGYRVGQTITALPGIGLAGQYDIFAQEGLQPAVPRGVGSVQIVNYSHGGPGVASPTPLGFPGTDGSNGLGSEGDTVLGTDGQLHAFGPGAELSFPTADLFGFIFTYTDGAAFYSGSVAVTAGTTPVIPTSAGILGSYSFFAEGVTTRAANTVVIDRFTAGDQTPPLSHAGPFDGASGLGSETASINVNGTLVSFGDLQEPVVTGSVPTVPVTPPPGTSAVITAEVLQTYSEILDRSPNPAELQTYSTELANGTSLSSVRAALAQSPEAQGDLTGLYQLIFDRAATLGELSTDTGELISGSSLQTVQLMLAQSPEAQLDIGAIYSAVLGRAAAGSELTAYMVQLGNETAAAPADPSGRTGVAGVRDIIAHSPEAQTDLAQLFQGLIGIAPTAAQLAGMEDQLSKPGVSQATLGTALTNGGATAAGTTIAVGAGNATWTATAGTPTIFNFSNLGFGNDTIAGFDPTRDTIELPRTLVTNLATLLQQDTADAGGGTLITFNSTHSIVLSSVAKASLDQTNFLLV